MKRCGLLVVVIGVVSLLTGCTSSGDEEPDPAPSASVGATTSASATPSEQTESAPVTFPQADWRTPMTAPAPLAEYGVYMDGPAEDPAAAAARVDRHNNIQNAIAECMTAQGFQYVPVPAYSQASSPELPLSSWMQLLPLPLLPDDRAAVSRVGYGVMGTPEEQAIASGAADDPNVAHRASLDLEEGQKYDFALYGDYNDPAGTSAGSCSGQAMVQFPEPPPSDQMQAFQSEFGTLIFEAVGVGTADARPGGLDEAPGVRALNAEWEACMGTKGYTFEDETEFRGPSLAMGLAVRTRPDGTVGPVRYGVPAGDIPPEEKSLLGTAPERAVALADFDCRVETDYTQRLTEARISLDEQFIAEHQGELDRMVGAAESWS